MDDNNYIEESYVEGDNVFYTSGQVAEMLDLNRDMVRYYTNEFSEFVNPEKTKEGKGGHLRYHGADIETLRLILSLLKNNTPAETKAILNDKDVRLIYAGSGDQEKGFIKILTENNKHLAEIITNIIETKYLPEQKLLLEQKQLDDEKYEHILEELRQVKSENEEMRDLMKTYFEQQNKKKGIFKFFK